MKKVLKKKKLLKILADITVPIKVAQILNHIHFTSKYKWAMKKADIDITNKLILTRIKKYYRYAAYIIIEFY